MLKKTRKKPSPKQVTQREWRRRKGQISLCHRQLLDLCKDFNYPFSFFHAHLTELHKLNDAKAVKAGLQITRKENHNGSSK